MLMCNKLSHLNILTSFRCHNVLKYKRKMPIYLMISRVGIKVIVMPKEHNVKGHVIETVTMSINTCRYANLNYKLCEARKC